MRELDKYAEHYVNHPGFETQMVCFRRRKVLEILAGIPHARIAKAINSLATSSIIRV